MIPFAQTDYKGWAHCFVQTILEIWETINKTPIILFKSFENTNLKILKGSTTRENQGTSHAFDGELLDLKQLLPGVTTIHLHL